MTTARDRIKRFLNQWYVWLFPLFAVLISAWLFREFYHQRGPQIYLTFDDASGIQPEKTQLRFRGVNVGLVKTVKVSEDNKNIKVMVQLQRDAQQFARKGAKYWVVIPKIDLQGISGIETLFQGSYISAIPGDLKAEPVYEFTGKIGGESSDPLEDTVAYYLESSHVGAVTPGNPVSFRGLNIGNVTSVHLAKDGRSVIVQINVQNRYVRVIRTNSIFWRRSGIQADIGLFGAEVNIGSLESVMKGGIEVSTPPEPGGIANAQSQFRLEDEAPKGWEKWSPVLKF